MELQHGNSFFVEGRGRNSRWRAGVVNGNCELLNDTTRACQNQTNVALRNKNQSDGRANNKAAERHECDHKLYLAMFADVTGGEEEMIFTNASRDIFRVR